MTITLARARIVAMVESAIPPVNGLGLGAAFVHDKAQGPESTARVGRSFYLWTSSSSPRGYFTKTRAHESLVDLEVHVYYPDTPGNRLLLDEIIEADRGAITDRLLDETMWNRPTSGIINLVAAGLAMLPTRRETVAGGWESIITVPLHHR